jgi:hypothetical protein
MHAIDRRFNPAVSEISTILRGVLSLPPSSESWSPGDKSRGFKPRAELAIACLRRILKAADLDEARRYLLLNFVQPT